jgi:hypothetical protein
MLVKVPKPKHSSVDDGDRLVISLPKRRIWSMLFVFSVWGLILGVFEASMIAILIESVRAGIQGWLPALLMLAFISAVLIIVIYQIMMPLAGKEKIEISQQFINIGNTLFGLIIPIPRQYSSDHIRDLGLARVSVSDIFSFSQLPFPWFFNAGNISFDYGARTIRFAGGVDDAEAKQIIAEIKQKFPRYRSTS